ncbi:MAG: hypothetical protein LIO94_04515, partial [Clostridiales bacterium]|nr:hypothetical protein [Clostridiales bacterium]
VKYVCQQTIFLFLNSHGFFSPCPFESFALSLSGLSPYEFRMSQIRLPADDFPLSEFARLVAFAQIIHKKSENVNQMKKRQHFMTHIFA